MDARGGGARASVVSRDRHSNATRAAPRRPRHGARPERAPRPPCIRARPHLDRGVLHRGDVAGCPKPFPRGRRPRSAPWGRRAHPPRRLVVERRPRRRGERRPRRAAQRTRGCRKPTSRGPARRAVRARGPRPQQGRRRRRDDDPRVEHELGPRVRDGEPGGGDHPRGPRRRSAVRGRPPRGLDDGRRRELPNRRPCGRRCAVRHRRRRIVHLAPEIERHVQTSKAPRPDGNAWRPKSSPPPRSKSSATAR